MTIVKLYDFPRMGDERGGLVAMDQTSGVPFDIRRVYYVLGTRPGVTRGLHAHKKLHQIAVCVAGSCRMTLDDGVEREDVIMDSSKVAVDLPPMLWHEMHDFSVDCVLLVLASDYYDESDYIRDYIKFKDTFI